MALATGIPRPPTPVLQKITRPRRTLPIEEKHPTLLPGIEKNMRTVRNITVSVTPEIDRQAADLPPLTWGKKDFDCETVELI